MRKINKDSKCEYSIDGLSCQDNASYIVYDREQAKVLLLCEGHAEIVEYSFHSEYVVFCPNCNCQFGVN